MGRKNKDKKRKLKDLHGKEKDKKRGAGYSFIVKENAAFETYYKNQGIVPEEEWNNFIASMKENLPSSFRITGTRSHAKVLLKIFQDYFNKLSNVVIDGEPINAPVCLPWYPGGLAWQMKLDRKTMRKSETFAKLHSFFISETESGYISRQETVSMIPPLLLDVQPHHKVLDMCAAPGSKTAQLIEMLHSDDSTIIPDGFVIGNDADNKRCYLLVHQAKRLQSPCFMITNHDAGFMPNILFKLPSGETTHLRYDRILCDVPCSGDGTMRKNPDVWRKWNAANGNNLHGLQTRIVRRGLKLLAVDGLLVYSTCSLNPIEDEAVICSLLQQSEGSVELVDVSHKLTGLIYKCGLSSWKVMTRNLKWFTEPNQVPDDLKTQIGPNLFPPSPEIAESLHLDRCIRILSHLQDTGGFFVAVLRKVTLLPWETKKTKIFKHPENVLNKESNDASPIDEDFEPPSKKRRLFGFKEDPYVFIKENEQLWPPVQEFFQIDKEFPYTQLLTRSYVGKKKNVYFVSKAIKDIITNNEDRLKVVNTGIRVLCQNNGDSACCFRLAQEGLQTWLPFLHGRRLNIPKDDLITLLTNENPYLGKMSHETKLNLKSCASGSLIFIYTATDSVASLQFTIELVGWKGKASIRCFVPSNERIHYLRLCGVDTSQYEHQEIQERKQKQSDNLKVTDHLKDEVQEKENGTECLDLVKEVVVKEFEGNETTYVDSLKDNETKCLDSLKDNNETEMLCPLKDEENATKDLVDKHMNNEDSTGKKSIMIK